MCIIVAKRTGIAMPDRTILKTCFDNNPDGAGVMWNEERKVHIRKGFMTWYDFECFTNKLEKRLDLTETSVVVHFRITTHGGTNPHNCHPFPISSRVRDLKKLNYETDLAVCHNGVIPIKCIPKLSDTQTYIVKRLSTFRKRFYENKACMKQIECEIQSKMCFLTDKGEIYLIGDFIEDNGIFYSNSSYKSYFDFGGYDLEWLCPVEGYIIDEEGSLHESSDFEYLIDANGNIYEYDYCYDCAVQLENARAYHHVGMPYRFDRDSAFYLEVIR